MLTQDAPVRRYGCRDCHFEMMRAHTTRVCAGDTGEDLQAKIEQIERVKRYKEEFGMPPLASEESHRGAGGAGAQDRGASPGILQAEIAEIRYRQAYMGVLNAVIALTSARIQRIEFEMGAGTREVGGGGPQCAPSGNVVQDYVTSLNELCGLPWHDDTTPMRI